MNKKIELNEGTKEFQELRKKWLSLKPQSEKELFDFIHELTTNYENDYGTCVHMAVALMKAVFEYCEHLEGYTGFQVGCMQWEVLTEIFQMNDKIGIRYQKYEDLLYPQNAYHFNQVELSKTQVDTLIKMAKENLKNTKYAAKNVVAHWKKLAKGNLPPYIVVKEN